LSSHYFYLIIEFIMRNWDVSFKKIELWTAMEDSSMPTRQAWIMGCGSGGAGGAMASSLDFQR